MNKGSSKIYCCRKNISQILDSISRYDFTLRNLILAFVFFVSASVRGQNEAPCRIMEFDAESIMSQCVVDNIMITNNILIPGIGVGEITSGEIEVPWKEVDPFLAFSFGARIDNYSEITFTVNVRTADEIGWSEWIEVKGSDDSNSYNQFFTSELMFFTSSVRKIQFRVQIRNTHELIPRLESLVLNFILPSVKTKSNNTGSGLNEGHGEETLSCPCPQPTYIARSSWGGSSLASCDPLEYTDVTHLIVHHQGQNGTIPTNYSAVVYSIYLYHTTPLPSGKGFCDIAYNWLVAPNGQLFEGRAGGENVQGAHFSCMNSGTAGICVLDNYDNNTLSASSKASLESILSWLACRSNIPSQGSVLHSASGLTLNRISGHRDGNPADYGCPSGTSCPGNNLYNLLPTIRTNVSNFLNTCDGIQPPSNDNCSNAVLISGLQVGSCVSATSGEDIATATQSLAPSSNCGGPTSADALDVWFKFVAICSTHTITVNPSTSMDAAVSVHSSCNSSALACADNAGGANANETITYSGFVVGSTYYIRVYDYNNSLGAGTYPATTTFDVCVGTPTANCEEDCPNPPSNDNCSNAVTINNLQIGQCVSATSGEDIECATQSLAPSSNCGGPTSSDALDVWFKFVAICSTHTITVNPSTSMDAAVSVHSGCNSSALVCADNAGGANANETITYSGFVVGSTYYIRVYDYNNSLGAGTYPATTTFDVCVGTPTANCEEDCPNPPSNDNCSNAVTINNLQVGQCVSSTSGEDIGCATQSLAPSSNCGGPTSADAFDVWFKFVAICTTHTITVDPSTSMDAAISVHSGCNSSALACADNAGGANANETITYSGFVVGSTYYIRVYDYNNSLGAGTYPATTTFDVCVGTPTAHCEEDCPNPPSNDNCSNAVTINSLQVGQCVSATSGEDIGCATQSLAPSSNCGGPTSADAFDVWFKFVAICTTHTITVDPSTSMDAAISVHAGCNSSALACADNAGGVNANETITYNGFVVGSTYYIRVYDYNNSLGAGTYPTTTTFDVCVGTPTANCEEDCPNPPSNDNCSNAVTINSLQVGQCVSATSGEDIGCATQSLAPSSNCGGPTSADAFDVWFKFVAICTTHIITVDPSTSMDAAISVHSGCNSSALACADNAGGVNANETITYSGFVVGSTYYIRVYDYNNSLGAGTYPATTTFDVCVDTPSIDCDSDGIDLSIGNISIDQQEPIMSGEVISLCATIENVSSLNSTSPIFWDFYIDGNIVGSDSSPAMAAGGNTSTCDIPYTFESPGTYEFCVTIQNTNDESDLSNNSACIWVVVISNDLSPDLVINALSIDPEYIQPGGTGTVTFNVTNIGGGDAGSSIMELWLTATDNTTCERSNATQYLQYYEIGGLESGESQEVSFEVSYPDDIIPSEYQLMFSCDDDLDIVESNESNNTDCVPISITTSVSDLFKSNSFVIYPNPNDGSFTIEINLDNTSDISVEVRNVVGQLIYSLDQEIFAGVYRKGIDLNLASGIYNVHFNSGLKREFVQLVVRK